MSRVLDFDGGEVVEGDAVEVHPTPGQQGEVDGVGALWDMTVTEILAGHYAPDAVRDSVEDEGVRTTGANRGLNAENLGLLLG